jgi:hypothetical protein
METDSQNAKIKAHLQSGRSLTALAWIVLSEWVNDNGWKVKCVKSAKIDGIKLLPDTFYKLENGKFIK